MLIVSDDVFVWFVMFVFSLVSFLFTFGRLTVVASYCLFILHFKGRMSLARVVTSVCSATIFNTVDVQQVCIPVVTLTKTNCSWLNSFVFVKYLDLDQSLLKSVFLFWFVFCPQATTVPSRQIPLCVRNWPDSWAHFSHRAGSDGSL